MTGCDTGRLGVAGKQAEQASLEARQAGGQEVAREEGKWALLEVRQASEQSGPRWRRGRWTRGGR